VVAGRQAGAPPKVPRRGAVYWVDLDPTRGSEIQKTRPCVVVSPDELNAHLRTVIVAPVTSGGQPYPWRVECRVQEKDGRVALDQLRLLDSGPSDEESERDQAGQKQEPIRRHNASANAVGCRGGTSKPVRSCSTMSGIPPTRVATTGKPQRIASAFTIPNAP
jgi:mRNA-degrading endonuclease toxin of MazEF toxin-antitoxin module